MLMVVVFLFKNESDLSVYESVSLVAQKAFKFPYDCVAATSHPIRIWMNRPINIVNASRLIINWRSAYNMSTSCNKYIMPSHFSCEHSKAYQLMNTDSDNNENYETISAKLFT